MSARTKELCEDIDKFNRYIDRRPNKAPAADDLYRNYINKDNVREVQVVVLSANFTFENISKSKAKELTWRVAIHPNWDFKWVRDNFQHVKDLAEQVQDDVRPDGCSNNFQYLMKESIAKIYPMCREVLFPDAKNPED